MNYTLLHSNWLELVRKLPGSSEKLWDVKRTSRDGTLVRSCPRDSSADDSHWVRVSEVRILESSLKRVHYIRNLWGIRTARVWKGDATAEFPVVFASRHKAREGAWAAEAKRGKGGKRHRTSSYKYCEFFFRLNFQRSLILYGICWSETS